MAITFETIAAPGNTPIANNGTSAKSFDNNYAKLMSPGITKQQRKALMINAMIYILALTGEDYTRSHNELIQDASVYTKGISNLDIFGALAATSVAAGNTQAAMSLDLTTLLNEVRDIVQLPDLTQDRVIAFLAAQLGI